MGLEAAVIRDVRRTSNASDSIMSIEMKRVFAALVPCEGPDYMINETALRTRILKQQLGTGPKDSAGSPVILAALFSMLSRS